MVTTRMPLKCYGCGKENPDQAFCGACGSPLGLNDYISTVVKEQVSHSIRDRDVLEMDSSINVFNKAWSWIRLIFGIAVTLLIFAGLGIFWKASDFWTAVGTAKQSVVDSASGSRADIIGVASKSKQDIATALAQGKTAIDTASNDAIHQSQDLKKVTVQSKADISNEINSFQSDLAGSRKQLQAADQLQPQMSDMQKQLAQAISDIQSQQKVISSSQDFVKGVFSSHVFEVFQIGQPPATRYAVVPPPPGTKVTTVLLLLQSVPIPSTLQLQFHIFAQPPNSYFTIKNLVIFGWSDPPEVLKTQQLSASYFPDSSDKDIIHSLSEHDGRIFADDQPLPKFNQVDPDFKGNKWMPVVQNPAKP
jgi:hypothetical protein